MGNVDGNINQHNAGWSFEHISEDFDSHIQRSIPLYKQGHELICQYSDFFLKPDSLVYDIGCSTGQFLAKLARRHPQKTRLRLIGIDTVEDMIGYAHALSAEDQRLSFVVANALDLQFESLRYGRRQLYGPIPSSTRAPDPDRRHLRSLELGRRVFHVRKGARAG
jgi:tRNA (cmo5U34)-methyltransferase